MSNVGSDYDFNNMADKTQAEIDAETASAKAAEDAKKAEEAKATEEAAKNPQDNIDKELGKPENKGGKTEKEKAEYSLKMNAKRLRELGGDPAEALDLTPPPIEDDIEDDDDIPVTKGMLKQMQRETAKGTALELADAITDEKERDLVKSYLQNRIRPSGNPQEDLNFARAAVNSVKNGQIVDTIIKKNDPKRHSGSGGNPALDPGEIFTPTAEERAFMGPPYNLTKEEVLKVRPKN